MYVNNHLIDYTFNFSIIHTVRYVNILCYSMLGITLKFIIFSKKLTKILIQATIPLIEERTLCSYKSYILLTFQIPKRYKYNNVFNTTNEYIMELQ